MEKGWLNSMLLNKELEYRCKLSKSTDSLDPIENTSLSEGTIINDNDMDKSIPSRSDNDNFSYSTLDHLVAVSDIQNFISDDTFLVKDSNTDSFSIYFDIENKILEIDNDHSFVSELKSPFSFYCTSSYLKNISKSYDSNYDRSMYDTKYSWNNQITSCIESYICSESASIRDGSDFTRTEDSNNLDVTKKYRHLWVQCENCYGLNYKKFLKSKMNICEQCGYHLKMSSSDRIDLSIDPGTWAPMDEDMVSLDPIEFHSEEEPYKDRIDSYQRKTGLTEAVQTGTGQLNGIPVAIGVMDFQFMGGSMGSVVGEKITRLIEYATNQCLPLILVCASGGARMQEGSLSLMQMAKISSALYDYQSNKNLFYVSILTSPTTGGVTASFGMLGDIIIAEPNAYIAFAGKRVIEQTLNKTLPEGSQSAEYLFHKGLFDPIVPRNPLKGILSELFHLHVFFPLNQN
uniref:acetyl-CoA carboxylase beta subunit n=1 Tax=Begonia samhaensis TaxID=198428 RepID=UPI0022FD4D27|nr:acetyl-CoA carboxylase beta subunit [Begonia samhaensis]WBN96876.1 acetyl-CoA carboxylase beta subunit [Begonia samhaensis]